MNAFDMPAAINMYLTDAGQQLSALPHTDKQDVFVLQTQGKKHWRVFAPPPPSAMPKNDPYSRGKSKDVLKLEELGQPLIDVVLELAKCCTCLVVGHTQQTLLLSFAVQQRS